MILGLDYNAKFTIVNHSNQTFSRENTPDTFITYRLFIIKDNRPELLQNNGPLLYFPSVLKPSSEIEMIFPIKPPRMEGHFYIQFDIIKNDVAWFSFKNQDEDFPLLEFNIRNSLSIPFLQLRAMKKIFYLETPEHGNIGDQGIAMGSKAFLTDKFNDYLLFEFSFSEEIQYIDYIKSILNKDDVIVLHGGGNLGTLYIQVEKQRRLIIDHFPNNKIIILPQTIFFTDDDNGRRELITSVKTYSRRNLLLVARDSVSLDISDTFFSKCSQYICPDMFLYYCKNIAASACKKEVDVLTVFRSDGERNIDSSIVIDFLNQQSIRYESIDMNNDCPEKSRYQNIKKEMREFFVLEKLNEFRRAKLVLTDRFHGVLFSIAANVPCIVFNNSYHKLEESVKWFTDNENIVFAGDNYNFAMKCIPIFIELEEPKQYRFDMSHFDELAKAMRVFIGSNAPALDLIAAPDNR